MKDAIAKILEELGLDLNDPNFAETPERFRRALVDEILSGINDSAHVIQEAIRTSFPAGDFNSIVIVANLETYSFCPHHLLPIKYEIDIGYLPPKHGQLLGLSKLGRIAEVLSKRPVMQETLTHDIAKVFMNDFYAQGVGVITVGAHSCMRMRGIKQHKSVAILSTMLGAFHDSPNTRMEFLELLKIYKRVKL